MPGSGTCIRFYPPTEHDKPSGFHTHVNCSHVDESFTLTLYSLCGVSVLSITTNIWWKHCCFVNLWILMLSVSFFLPDFCRQPGGGPAPAAVGRCRQARWRGGRGEGGCREGHGGGRCHQRSSLMEATRCHFFPPHPLEYCTCWQPRLIHLTHSGNMKCWFYPVWVYRWSLWLCVRVSVCEFERKRGSRD